MRPLWGVAAAAVLLAGCGGSKRGTAPPSAGVQPDRAYEIGRADLELSAAASSTRAIVGHPQAVARAKQLLKPLVVARTLRVNASNPVAGNLIEGIAAELDNTVPGLTGGSAAKVTLEAGPVHRLLLYGAKDPTRVFRPEAGHAVARLERLLHGLGAQVRVSALGAEPVVTVGSLLDRDIRTARPYWPDLARRLEQLR